jgi:hypothetical protein
VIPKKTTVKKSIVKILHRGITLHFAEAGLFGSHAQGAGTTVLTSALKKSLAAKPFDCRKECIKER